MPHNRSREEWCELLGLLEAEQVIQFADRIIADNPEVRLERGPEVGSIVLQVREPIARERFQLADMTVTTAEASVGGVRGWAMRPGSQREAAVAQSICEAELAREGELAAELRALLEETSLRHQRELDAERKRLAATIVEFEEVL